MHMMLGLMSPSAGPDSWRVILTKLATDPIADISFTTEAVAAPVHVPPMQWRAGDQLPEGGKWAIDGGRGFHI